MLKIGPTAESLQEVPTPSGFSVSISDLDASAERNTLGDTVRDRIATKRKLQISYNALDQGDASAILNAIAGEFFYVQYPDPQLGITTKQFYVGDRSAPLYRYDFDNMMWKGMSFNSVER